MHLESPRRTLGEMVRVTRPGGRVVVSDTDWETLVIDSPYREVTRKLVNLKCDNVRNGWIGHQMPAAFKDGGLQEVEVDIHGWAATDFELADRLLFLRSLALQGAEDKVVSQDEAARWIDHLEKAAARDRFFCAATVFITSGAKLQS